jgi:hypothetical protein
MGAKIEGLTAEEPTKLVIVGFKVKAKTQREANAHIREQLKMIPWGAGDRIRKVRVVSLPRPKKCKHLHTHDLEKEQFDWHEGKTRHWRETFCEDCGARVNISEGYYE